MFNEKTGLHENIPPAIIPADEHLDSSLLHQSDKIKFRSRISKTLVRNIFFRIIVDLNKN